MATFNIYGCCICRDLFGLVPDNQHEVIHFLQSSSQITNFIYPTKPQRKMTDEDFSSVSGISKFMQKCIINDYNKTVLDYYVERSDYFIIDLINIANTNIAKQTSDNGHEHYFTFSAWFKDALDAGLKDFFKGSDLEQINRLRFTEHYDVNEVLDKMLLWLKETLGYRNDQIILIENKRTSFYKDGETFRTFSPGTIEKVNTYMNDIYQSFEGKCSGCHVIKAPFGSYADTRHPLGLTDLHYAPSYYEYLYLCVNAIVSNQNSKQKIERLHEKYSKLNEKSITQFIQKTNVVLNEKIVN